MNFKEAVKSVFSKYVIADGRACRSEFWFFVLFNLLVQIIIIITVKVTHYDVVLLLIPIHILITILPGISVMIRRMHDVGRTGWLYLLQLVPIIGTAVILIWLCSASQPGSNKYGPNPKENQTSIQSKSMLRS